MLKERNCCNIQMKVRMRLQRRYIEAGEDSEQVFRRLFQLFISANQINAGNIDIGVVILPIINTDNYHIIPAMSSDNALIVNKDHPLASRDEVDFKELEHEDFLILDRTYMLHDRIIKNCEIAGFYPHITTESSQWDFLAEMVAYNQGISILPVPIMKRFYSSDRIKMIRLKEPEFPWNIAMIFKKEKLITAQMEEFIHFVVNNKDTVKEYTQFLKLFQDKNQYRINS